MYEEAVPPSLHAIDRALHLVDRIEEAGKEGLLTATLDPGMFDCAVQLRTVGIFALRSTWTLAGRDWPKDLMGKDFPSGTEGLRARLRLADRQVRQITPADLEGAETREIAHIAGDAHLTQAGADYLRLFALPNLWFHLSMAYAILRANGLDIGKADYDGFHAYAPGFSYVRR